MEELFTIVSYRYIKVFNAGGLVGLTVDAINEEGACISNPLLQLADDVESSSWEEITVDEFKELAREHNLCQSPETPEPKLFNL
jgi:hypothetical protein